MFGGGSSAPPLPAPQPVVPVPQEDDPKSHEAQRKAAVAASQREGYSAHLLTGTDVKEDPEVMKPSLIGTA